MSTEDPLGAPTSLFPLGFNRMVSHGPAAGSLLVAGIRAFWQLLLIWSPYGLTTGLPVIVYQIHAFRHSIEKYLFSTFLTFYDFFTVFLGLK